MTYHVIKVMAVEVPGFKELQDLQEQKRSSPYIVDIHSNADLCCGSIVWRMFTL